jgi:hypothetical protein
MQPSHPCCPSCAGVHVSRAHQGLFERDQARARQAPLVPVALLVSVCACARACVAWRVRSSPDRSPPSALGRTLRRRMASCASSPRSSGTTSSRQTSAPLTKHCKQYERRTHCTRRPHSDRAGSRLEQRRAAPSAARPSVSHLRSPAIRPASHNLEDRNDPWRLFRCSCTADILREYSGQQTHTIVLRDVRHGMSHTTWPPDVQRATWRRRSVRAEPWFNLAVADDTTTKRVMFVIEAASMMTQGAPVCSLCGARGPSVAWRTVSCQLGHPEATRSLRISTQRRRRSVA